MSSKPDLYTFDQVSKTQGQTIAVSGLNAVVVNPTELTVQPATYNALPSYSFSESATLEKNAVSLAIAQVTNDTDSMDSFKILPVASPELMTEDLTQWGEVNFYNIAAGVYSLVSSTFIKLIIPSGSDITNLNDTQYGTSFQMGILLSPFLINGAPLVVAIKFKLPAITNGETTLDFDSVSLGICATLSANAGNVTGALRVRLKKFFVNAAGNTATPIGVTGSSSATITWDNILNDYYSDSPSGPGDYNCYTKETQTEVTPLFAHGYQNPIFALPNLTKDNYTQFQNAAILFEINWLDAFPWDFNGMISGGGVSTITSVTSLDSASLYAHGDIVYVYQLSGADGHSIIQQAPINTMNGTIMSYTITLLSPLYGFASGGVSITKNPMTLDIKELCLIFHKTSSVKDAVYSGLAGRVFNDDWASRKSVTGQIQSPKDFIEHFCRLSDLSDVGTIMPASGWGKAYPSGSLPIDNATFDAVEDNSNIYPGAQVFTDTDGYSDQLKQVVCRNFGMINYINITGQEALYDLFKFAKTGCTPSIALTLGNVLDRTQIKVSSWPPDRVFPEITVNFDKDYGADSLQNFLQILNVIGSTEYAAGAVILGNGDPLDDSIARMLWLNAFDLYSKFNKPMSIKTNTTINDLAWANGMNALNIAINYIVGIQKLAMCDFLEFTCSYQLAQDWHICTEFTFSSPKHTGIGIARKCIITEIEHEASEPYETKIKALMLPVSFTWSDGTLIDYPVYTGTTALTFIPLIDGDVLIEIWFSGSLIGTLTTSMAHTFATRGDYTCIMKVGTITVATRLLSIL